MIARLLVQLPFTIAVPDGAEFVVYGYEDEGCEVRFYPPCRSDQCTAGRQVDVKIGGRPAFFADLLRIDFHRDSFSRCPNEQDPPEAVIKRAVDSLVARIRHVANAPQARSVNFPQVTWRLQYLDDSGQELERDESLVRARLGLARSVSYVGLDEAAWNDIHSLPPDYEPEPWDELLLEAQFELPRIGPAVVLAATALEVLISRTLDTLAVTLHTPALWEWVNARSDILKRPTVEEQFDSLLHLFTGHSLKSERQLWASFMNLKQARNTFVHTGVARIGSHPVSAETAGKLVRAAQDVVAKVREWLPEEQRWTVLKHGLQVETTIWFFDRAEAKSSVPQDADPNEAAEI